MAERRSGVTLLSANTDKGMAERHADIARTCALRTGSTSDIRVRQDPVTQRWLVESVER